MGAEDGVVRDKEYDGPSNMSVKVSGIAKEIVKRQGLLSKEGIQKTGATRTTFYSY